MATRTIVYAVDHSYPFSSDGYAVRTAAIAETLVELGYRVVVVNRPGRLWTRKGFDSSGVKTRYHQNGVDYIYLQQDDYPLASVYRVYRPELVIAASNHVNAMPAIAAAKKAGIYAVYEVRGFWELTRAYKDADYAASPQYTADSKAEADVANLADEVWTLNDLMRDELCDRGVAAAKIKLVPNALQCLPELPRSRGILHQRLGSAPQKTTIAYIGSFNHYEGLPVLIDAFAQLLEIQQANVQLVLIGSGATQGVDKVTDVLTDQLKKQAHRIGVAEHVYFSGRLKPADIASSYADIDIVVNPRLSVPVTNKVSSLKSVEALAYAKPLLLSDIPPHRLLADEVPDGLCLFEPDNAVQLAATLNDAVVNIQALTARAEKQRAWVADNRVFGTLLPHCIGF